LQATFNGANVISALTVDTGSIDVASGSLAFRRALNGAGVLQIGSCAVAEVDAAASSTLVADFAGNGATLALGLANVFRSTIRGFAGGDTIDLIDTTATSATLKAGDKLVIVNGAKIIATLSLSGNYSGDTFNVTSDGHGGSEITLATQAKAEAGPGVALFAQQLSAFAPQGATKLALSGAIPHLAAPAHLAQPRFQP
jgi:hypothetical protein